MTYCVLCAQDYEGDEIYGPCPLGITHREGTPPDSEPADQAQAADG